MSPLKINDTIPSKTASSTPTATSKPSSTVTGNTVFTQVPTGAAAAGNLNGNLVGLSLLQFGAVLVGFVF